MFSMYVSSVILSLELNPVYELGNKNRIYEQNFCGTLFCSNCGSLSYERTSMLVVCTVLTFLQ